MIDLNELHDKMVSYHLVGFTKSDISTIDALELLGRLQQAEKDAERYRWLRDCHIGNYPENINLDGRGTLDDAIDEAMQCSK